MSRYLSSQFKYIIFHIFTYLFTIFGCITNSHRDLLPVGLMAQLEENCIGIAEVTSWNPVQIWFTLCSMYNGNDQSCLHASDSVPLSSLLLLKWNTSLHYYRIYSNKRRVAYLIFRATSAALIRGRRLFKHCTRQIYFFYIFIQRYTFYLLISQWTDTKLIVNLELLANSFVVVEQFTARAEKYSHFELKNITFKENKLPMLF